MRCKQFFSSNVFNLLHIWENANVVCLRIKLCCFLPRLDSKYIVFPLDKCYPVIHLQGFYFESYLKSASLWQQGSKDLTASLCQGNVCGFAWKRSWKYRAAVC